MSEFLSRDFADRPIKQRLEAIATGIWLDDVDRESLKEITNPWAFYEIASKTQFRRTDDILSELTQLTGLCDRCVGCCRELITAKEHMPVDVFVSDECCLLDWKKEMRQNHDYFENTGPQLDFTIAIIKPNNDPNTLQTLQDVLSEGQIVAAIDKQLTEEDIAFLYTSAYGRQFMQELIGYMTSIPVQVLLLRDNDIGLRQNEMKTQIRLRLTAPDKLHNNIHFPDSFHESLAQSTYFFPKESRIYARA